jgi:REP element-mobilizing transposase RayT
MRNRRLYIHNTALAITSRTEEGLPLTACKLINKGIWGILARAKSLYDISVCHLVFMPNHFHMLAVVKTSQDVSPFIGYIKQETSAMINRIRGVRQNTVWTDSFHCAILLTQDKAIDWIKYIYKNPANAHLVKSINDYPNVSSWNMFKNGMNKAEHLWLKRSKFYEIKNLHALSDSAQSKIITKMAGDKPEYNTFELEPKAWMDCYPDFENVNREEFNQKLINEILAEEQKILHENGVLGIDRLKTQPIDKEYKSKKYSKKLFCMSSNIDLRVKYIAMFKSVSKLAHEAYQLIKNGVCNISLPAGTILPGGRILQELSKTQFYEMLEVGYT